MNNPATKTDPNAQEWAITDEVVRLREWGTDHCFPLPTVPVGEVTIGASDDCKVRLADASGRTSRRHAVLSRTQSKWTIRDLGSKNGLKLDGARRDTFLVEPGVEIGVGSLTLIAESGRSIALRGFLARILGWTSDRAEVIDHALRSIRMAAVRRAALVLCGESDLVALAHAIHRLALGSERPFVACDPRRRESKVSVRAVQNYASGMLALGAASGGSLCVWGSRLPRDFAEVRAALLRPDTRVQLVVCSNKAEDGADFLAVPIQVNPIANRTKELTRIVDEYARDAVSDLGATADMFKTPDRDWVIEHASSSLSEIEKATLRLVALRVCGNVNRAAARLGMAHVSLSRWIGRRKLPMQVES